MQSYAGLDVCIGTNEMNPITDVLSSGLVDKCFVLPFLQSIAVLLELLLLVQADTLIAYQACYDLFENEMQAFLLKASLASDPSSLISPILIRCFKNA